MKIQYGKGGIQFGPGVDIYLTNQEVATAIEAYLVAHRIDITGARSTTVNENALKGGRVYVDPSGHVIARGRKISGRGPK